jgi:hypothetical protein
MIPHSPQDGIVPTLPKRWILEFWIIYDSEKHKNSAILSVIHHRGNPLECAGTRYMKESCSGSSSRAPRYEITKNSILFLEVKMGTCHVTGEPPTKTNKQTNSVALSPQANYTDWTTATCRQNLVPTFVDRGVSRGQRGGSPTAVKLSFLDRGLYFSFK